MNLLADPYVSIDEHDHDQSEPHFVENTVESRSNAAQRLQNCVIRENENGLVMDKLDLKFLIVSAS